MPKKMHDILPPKKAQAKKPGIVALPLEKKKRTTRKKQNPVAAAPIPEIKKPVVQAEVPRPNKKRKFTWAWLWMVLVAIIIIGGAYAFFKLPKADIEIWPQMTALNVNATIAAEKSAASIDLVSDIIPAQYIQVSKSGQQDFPSTGSSDNQGLATGKIIVYNKISPSTPFTLVKGTHFLSDSNTLYVTLSKVVVPAARGSAAGSVTVSVQAEAAGANYNIGASQFSIPGLSGSAYYSTVYGESTTPMSGGYTGKVKEVNSDDLSGAQDVLVKQLTSQAETSLKSQLTADDVLLDGAMVSNVVSATSSQNAGAIADTFNESAQVQVSALVFKKSDLESFITSQATTQLPAGKTFLAKSLSINDTPGAIDMKNGKETINTKATIQMYTNMSTNDLAGLFAGKSADQIKQIMDQMYSGDVAQLKINFWPFWVQSAPINTNRVKVNLNF